MSSNQRVSTQKRPLTGIDIAVALCLLRAAITQRRTNKAKLMASGAYSTRSTGSNGPPG
jgi:hypothetical protein